MQYQYLQENASRARYQAHSYATATAQVKANATAEALANASPIAYPPTSTSPVLDDPLQDNSKGNKWEVDDPGKGDCKFVNQAYDINVGGNTNEEWCPASATDFTDFIYEVQMKIIKGNGGGIVFRLNPANPEQYYAFVIHQDGSYDAYSSLGGLRYTKFARDSSSAIHQGLNQTNIIATVARGPIIELYINYKRVAVVNSNARTHGQIGVIVGDFETEVIFQNAKVWKL